MSDRRCELLDEYLCGWLSPQAAADFEAHLADCPACQEEASCQRQIDRLLAEGAAWTEPVPASLPGRIQQGVRAAQHRRLLGWSSAAAVIVLALGFWRAASVFSPSADRGQLAQRSTISGGVSNPIASPENAPPIATGADSQRQELADSSTAMPAEPPPARVRVTLVDPSSAILVPMEKP